MQAFGKTYKPGDPEYAARLVIFEQVVSVFNYSKVGPGAPRQTPLSGAKRAVQLAPRRLYGSSHCGSTALHGGLDIPPQHKAGLLQPPLSYQRPL